MGRRAEFFCADLVPPFSSAIVGLLIVVSMFMLSRLIQRLNDLQISNALYLIGHQDRAVIPKMFRHLDINAAGHTREDASELQARLGPRPSR